MSADPFIQQRIGGQPRHEQNVPASAPVPSPRRWVAGRPGELVDSQPIGALLGSPGPNVGYALKLAADQVGQWQLVTHEHSADAKSVVAEIAMRRASLFGRAPMKHDVDVAVALLGIDSPRKAGESARFHGLAHNYQARRALIDTIPDEALRCRPEDLGPFRGSVGRPS